MQDKPSQKSIDDAALSALLRAHDGDVALLYLYRLRCPGADLEQAAGALCRTLSQMREAEEKLQRLRLLPEGARDAEAEAAVPARPAPPPAPAEELPQYSAREISIRGQGDPAFAAVLDEAAKVLGRTLSGNDLRVLFGVYDHLALPAEVLLELLNHVAESYRDKYGESRRPSARAIEKEAYEWANREILTLEQAEDFLRRSRQRKSALGRVQALLGLQGRPLSATEQKYIEGWLELGFEDEALAIALDRTLVKTGKLAWRYMDAILRDWHQKGLHSPQEIEEKDGRGRKSSAAAPSGDKPMDIESLRKVIETI